MYQTPLLAGLYCYICAVSLHFSFSFQHVFACKPLHYFHCEMIMSLLVVYFGLCSLTVRVCNLLRKRLTRCIITASKSMCWYIEALFK